MKELPPHVFTTSDYVLMGVFIAFFVVMALLVTLADVGRR